MISAETVLMSSWLVALTPIVETLERAHEQLAHGRERHDDLVVLGAGPALGLHDPDQIERQAADVDGRADQAPGQAQVVGGRAADDRDPQVVIHRRLVEQGAGPHVVGEDRQIARGRADDAGRLVLVPAITSFEVVNSGATDPRRPGR